MQSPTAKCACNSCGVHLEYPLESEGASIACPACGVSTLLSSDPTPIVEQQLEMPLAAQALQSFNGKVRPSALSVFYYIGLIIVATAMILLPVLYVAMIGATAWGVYLWGTKFTFLLKPMGLYLTLVKAVCYFAPLFAGATLVLFMIKPLFARRITRAQPLALNPGSEPYLFAFVTKVCEAVRAPMPSRIDLSCELNASAGFRRGAFSFLGNDLVLTIGLPLVAGLNTRELAGVLAHEFGHFTQPFAMRLTYIIHKVNVWFARVVYERDAWDEALDETAAEAEGWTALIFLLAVAAVGCSRLILRIFMYLGHGIGSYMSRQMEYDADHYEIQLAGSDAFESVHRRVHVLAALQTPMFLQIRKMWQDQRILPDNLPALLAAQSSALDPQRREHIEDRMGLGQSGLFDTHPSNGDRIRRSRRANAPGIMQFEAPASVLFTNFDAVARQVTMLHYEDDLHLPFDPAKLVSHSELTSR